MNSSVGCSRSEQRTSQDPLLPYLVALERLLRRQGAGTLSRFAQITPSLWLGREGHDDQVAEVQLELGRPLYPRSARTFPVPIVVLESGL
jgi:hypothetical protein